MIKILIGGSPCTFWSIVRQKKKQSEQRELQASGAGWELFKNYLVAKEKFKPDFFLYENNQSIAKDIKDQISRELGVDLVNINSSSVSAQNRKRFYAFNFEMEDLKDRGITLNDIIDDDVLPVAIHTPRFKEGKCRLYFDKSPTLTCAGGGGHVPRLLLKGFDPSEVTAENWRETSREIRVHEAEKLQTMPPGYAAGVSKTRAFNGLGNGWTAEVIIHILQGALKDVPKDEEIVVLSMYDGIGTGRYCLDKMGFTNVKYFAYEIDKYAKQIAMKNYPDIIQMGDAFDLRHPDWTIGY